MANVRIKDLTTDSALAAGDYVVIDSASEGSRKFDLGTEISGLKSELDEIKDGGMGVSDDLKAALLQLASKVAYIDDDGEDYYQDLYDALYPAAQVVSISAVYTQSGTVYDTDSLDSLKDDLVVTATYDDSTTAIVTTYTLSGTLTAGTSTITVTYNGKTTTFTVTVTAEWDVVWTYADGLPTDNGFTLDASGTYTVTETENGLQITTSGNSNNYVRYDYSNNDATGVFEATFMQTASEGRAFITFGNGVDDHIGARFQYSQNYKGIWINNSSSISSATKIVSSVSLNTEYTIRVEMDNGYGSIYVDGEKLADNVDISPMTGAVTTSFRFGCSSTTSTTALLKSMKARLGRLV